MKTQEELLKIYCAYLPYNLEVEIIENPLKGNIETLNGIPYSGVVHLDNSGMFGFTKREFSQVKPILYSMDMLTKEITHKGETFVPIVKLLQIAFPNQKGRYAETEFEEGYPKAWFRVDAGKDFKIYPNDLLNERFWVVQKLLEWHFNVFNLSENEYIKKENL